MKQVFQSLDSGASTVVDVPAPQVRAGHVLIRTQASVISAGTERMLVEFGQANLLAKARQQPAKVRQVLDKVSTDGLTPTMQAVRSKLGQPIPLGYANAGTVLAVGPDVDGFDVGDAVASNGPHAEVVSVPQNLVVPVPRSADGTTVPPEQAAFAPIGAIALQGVRLAQPTLGERFVVTGLGLIGLLTVQLLRAQGCQVLGIDFDRRRLELAERFGATTVDLSAGVDPVQTAEAFSAGDGVDGVLVTASTKSSEPIHQAALMCRRRGRIVLTGVTGLELDRAAFYEKELNFQVSCSYGPGRYDPAYEEGGQDYPFGFVRWTAGRNFGAFLDLIADERIDVSSLTTHRFDIADAASAYAALTESREALGVALEYPATDEQDVLVRHVTVGSQRTMRHVSRGRVAVIGAGNYTRQVLLPALGKTPAILDTIVSRGGATAAQAAHEFGALRAATDIEAVLADETIDTVIVTTRHDSHADLTVRALQAGKHVYVEKPLALEREDLDTLADTYARLQTGMDPPLLMVGFNRRFSPLTLTMGRLLGAITAPKTIVATVNAGSIPANHWAHDPAVGGGRIAGEGCHFIDLLRHLAGSPIVEVTTTFLDTSPRDTAAIQLRFDDGSMGTVHYVATGSRQFPKERVEVFAGGRVLQLDNFRTLRAYGWPDVKRERIRRQDKGHEASVAAFVAAVQGGGEPPIPVAQLFEVSYATLDAARR